MAACRNPGCLGNYDFDRIAFFAKKRFVEGCGTIELMAAAQSEQEKEEIALVSLLDLKDNEIRDLRLFAHFALAAARSASALSISIWLLKLCSAP